MFSNKHGGALRWFKGKQLLADVREGDYAHAGEEEAIKQVFSKLKKDRNRSILDVGSGRGGTANFMQRHGWGKVTGIDIEVESIQYSKGKYPEVEFYACDACSEDEIKEIFHERKFDLITLFHSLCVFPKQSEAIKALRKIAHDSTRLVIFEYEDLTLQDNPLNKTTETRTYFKINSRDQFINMLSEGGWSIEDRNIINVTNDFKRWYQVFLDKLDKKKDAIISDHGQEYYEKAKKRYSGMVEAINRGMLGGCIIYASSLSK